MIGRYAETTDSKNAPVNAALTTAVDIALTRFTATSDVSNVDETDYYYDSTPPQTSDLLQRTLHGCSTRRRVP